MDCTIPNCKSCTDVFNDAAVDLYLRDRFIRSCRILKAQPDGDHLTDVQLMLLPYRVCGYFIRNRKFYPLHIDRLQPIKWSKVGLDHLVLPADHKRMLLAIIRAQARELHQDSEAPFRDLVRGHGRGTVILLHGAPGLGKTTTAELVAEKLARPLLSLTIADLGSPSREMESGLTHYMKLAERWGCIMLIKNADEIVQQRDTTNSERNNTMSGKSTISM